MKLVQTHFPPKWCISPFSTELFNYVLQDELEVALALNGTSFVGLGWKPTDELESSCNSEIPKYMPVGKNS